MLKIIIIQNSHRYNYYVQKSNWAYCRFCRVVPLVPMSAPPWLPCCSGRRLVQHAAGWRARRRGARPARPHVRRDAAGGRAVRRARPADGRLRRRPAPARRRLGRVAQRLRAPAHRARCTRLPVRARAQLQRRLAALQQPVRARRARVPRGARPLQRRRPALRGGRRRRRGGVPVHARRLHGAVAARHRAGAAPNRDVRPHRAALRWPLDDDQRSELRLRWVGGSAGAPRVGRCAEGRQVRRGSAGAPRVGWCTEGRPGRRGLAGAPRSAGAPRVGRCAKGRPVRQGLAGAPRVGRCTEGRPVRRGSAGSPMVDRCAEGRPVRRGSAGAPRVGRCTEGLFVILMFSWKGAGRTCFLNLRSVAAMSS